MNDYHPITPRYEWSSSHQIYTSCRNLEEAALTTTAYCGAQGDINDRSPTIRLDKAIDEVQLRERRAITPTAREALGSRWLSSLSTTSPNVTAALARSGSVLHSRAKSWASNVPKLNASTAISPEKSIRQSKIFSDLFNGQSAPVHLGVPTTPAKEEEETEFVMEYTPKFTERPALRQQRRSSTLSAKATPTKAPRSSWFTRKQSQPSPAPPPATAPDELLTLNINNALFPHGPADPLSPQSFNDLLLNATTLLHRLQTAYKEKVDFIRSVQPEIDAQREEVAEADTRCAMYRSQLHDITVLHEEQKDVNRELAGQLAAEKMRLVEARDTRPAKQTVRLVHAPAVGEDARRRRKRGSAASVSDSGFESDADTASVWSAGVETPLSAHPSRPAPFPVSCSSDAAEGVGCRGIDVRTGVRTPPQLQQQQRSPLRAHRSLDEEGEHAAWATVEQLRLENACLTARVEELTGTVQDCIDLIGGAAGR